MLRFLTFLLLAVGLTAAAEKPNFLVLFTDDHGWGDVAAFGGRDVQTPHLDQLAAEGLKFTAMRANCTVCSPSQLKGSGVDS